MNEPPQRKQRSRPFFVLGLIAAVVLLAALASMPYGYYRFLRWAVAIAAVAMAVGAYGTKMTWVVWVLGLVALLFNPLVPFHLTRELWRPIDVSTALLLLVLGFVIRGKECQE